MVILRITKTLRKTLKSRILSKYICLINLIYQNLNFGGFGQQVPQTCLSLQLIARCLKNFRSSGVKSEIHHKHHVIYSDSLNAGIVSPNTVCACVSIQKYTYTCIASEFTLQKTSTHVFFLPLQIWFKVEPFSR